MEVIGKVRVIGVEMQVSASFKKRELVVVTDEQYPQVIMIEFAQDKCEYLDDLRVGEEVKVSVNLRGREWINPQGETKYFNSIQGWRIEKVGKSLQPHHANHPTNMPSKSQAQPQPYDSGDDGLPF